MMLVNPRIISDKSFKTNVDVLVVMYNVHKTDYRRSIYTVNLQLIITQHTVFLLLLISVRHGNWKGLSEYWSIKRI